MAREHEAKPGTTASEKKAGNGPQQEASASEAHDQWLPPGRNVNQVQDEPIPASHQDDGRTDPDEESPAPGAGGAAGGSRPAGATR
jgi:hypothetical protein